MEKEIGLWITDSQKKIVVYGEIDMENEGWVIVTVVVCAVILLFIALKYKSEWLMNIILRGIMGTIGIYIVNQILIMQNMSCEVGINPCTVAISSMLGFPGVILLYGIRFYSFM